MIHKAAWALLATLCAACGASPQTTTAAPDAAVSAVAEAGFAQAPQILSVRPIQAGLAVSGTSAPDAAVRMASPGGRAFSAIADGKGLWTITMPTLTEGALFGLSAHEGNRTVQAEGYVALLPPTAAAPLGALLRAGAGAAALGEAAPGAYIEAVDLDAARAAIVSGVAAPGGALTAKIDGVSAGESAAGPDRRFFIPLMRPLELGLRRIATSGPGGATSTILDVRAPAAPVKGPFQVQRLDGAWRIDWITPGGGLQTTYLLDRQGAGA